MLSALQHYAYCPRQCALIHIEQAFAENVHTLRGQAAHRLADIPGTEKRPGVRIERALPVWSEALGISGRCDVVEFLADGTPYPVEYKHGARRDKLHDDIQLAAQALCLEEMFGKPVPQGAIYHASSKRRRVVEISPDLRAQTRDTIEAVRAMLQAGVIPAPQYDARCKECSLQHICQPQMQSASARRQSLRAALFDVEKE